MSHSRQNETDFHIMTQQAEAATKLSDEDAKDLIREIEGFVVRVFRDCPETYLNDDQLTIEGDHADKYAADLERYISLGFGPIMARITRRLFPHTQPQEPLPHWLSVQDERNENALATRFITKYGDDLRFIPSWRRWLAWDGKRFKIDEGSTLVLVKARKLSKQLWGELTECLMGNPDEDVERAATAFVKSSNRNNGIKAFIDLAKGDERIIADYRSLDSNPHLLNLQNGTFNLSNGDFKGHTRSDLITQVANVAYDPDARCPKWKDTLSLIFDHNENLIRYVRQLLGYSLSGETGEHILPICWGSGCNGKSTVWNATIDMMGDYGTLANDSLLLGSKDSHPTEKAQLYQKRLVAISEPEQGCKMRESRVKELTGDDKITARRMREDFWTFSRTHTFWLSTNHLPRVSGTDEGIWRRIKLIPFTVDLRDKVEPIPDFHKWLVENEGPGILNWMLDGYADYQANGFAEPEEVKKAGKEYKGEQDQISNFVSECCLEGQGRIATGSDLYQRYKRWGGQWSQTAFGKEMANRYDKEKATAGPYKDRVVYEGIGLLYEESSSEY